MAEHQADIEAGRLERAGPDGRFLDRIEATNRKGPTLNAVIETNPTR